MNAPAPPPPAQPCQDHAVYWRASCPGCRNWRRTVLEQLHAHDDDDLFAGLRRAG